VFWAREWAGEGYGERLKALRQELSSPAYRTYIDGRLSLQPRPLSATSSIREPGEMS